MKLAKMIIAAAIVLVLAWIIYDSYFNESSDTVPVEKIGNLLEGGPSDFYRWIDENGVVHLTNEKERIPKSYEDSYEGVNLPELTVLDAEFTKNVMDNTDFSQPPPKVDNFVEHGDRVQLFGTRWCPKCKKVRAYLNSKNVNFADLDVEQDAYAMAKLLELTKGQSAVPVMLINGHTIMGFHPKEIDRYLKRKSAK